MKIIESLALVSFVSLATVTGCASSSGTSGGETLGATEDQLVTDNDEVEETDADLESGIDDSLSGASDTDPGSPALDTDEAARGEKIKSNPGRFFKPAGCITSTLAGKVATHVFKDCSGPFGLAKFNGTVTSNYDYGNGTLTVTHEANGLSINGATITGKRVVVYTKSGSVVSKRRTGNWTGTTAKGKAITHTADFTSTWDPTSKCITRDGSAQTQIGGRTLDVTVAGYKRCGIGNLGCPESGEITLTRTKGDKTGEVIVTFLGGRQVKITGPKGNSVTRNLVCRAAS